MTITKTRTLKTLAFVLATIGATGALVAAGLAEEAPAPDATVCHACAPGSSK